MDPVYIDARNQACKDCFTVPVASRAQLPELTLEAEYLDFVCKRDDLRRVAEQIQAALCLAAYPVALPLGGEP
jgi:hypothetical protein